MPSSPIRKLSGIAQKIEAEGIKVYHLNIGQPDLPSPQIGLDTLKNINRNILEYTPSQGFLSLRKKLCDYYEQYQIKFDPDDIIVTSGGSEAVLFAFMTCLNPGDEIIVPEPAYANYMAFAVSAGAIIKPIVSTIEDGFALPPIEKFEELITERTKGILICNPNNPTGYLYSRKEMLQLRDLVKKYDLYLFSDEVYREFIYTGSPYISACHLEGIEDHVILIDSVSKRYSECGIRIGAIATKNQEVRNAVMKFCQARLCPPLIGQVVAEASISAPREYMNATYEEFITRRKFLIDGLNKIPGVSKGFKIQSESNTFRPSGTLIVSIHDNKGNIKLSLRIMDILYAVSEDNYVKVFYEQDGELKNSMIRTTAKNIEDDLEGQITRCHRSYLINIAKVKFFNNDRDNLYVILDHEGINPIPVSRSYRDTIATLLSK